VIDPVELLQLARDLAVLDPRRPRQVALRRAVSTAYYALYHRIVLDGANHLVGYWAAGDDAAVGEAATRWFTHTRVAAACAVFAGATPAGRFGSKAGAAVAKRAVSAELQTVARAFLELQSRRHEADYDGSVDFTRQEVLNVVRRTEKTFEVWRACEDPFWKRFLLIALSGDTFIVDRA
jgi:hypothetical protein